MQVVEILPFCECGCNQKISRLENRFVKGHGTRGKTYFQIPREVRICATPGCRITFECKINDKKKYCCSGHASKGRPRSEIYKKKQRKPKSLGFKEKLSKILKEVHSRPNVVEHHRQAAIKRWQDPLYREKQIKAMFRSMKLKPNNTENVLNGMLQELFPDEYKYVGDGSTFIGGKCPDFLNVNGQKKIIELFGDYWHGKKRTGISNDLHEQERKNHFAKYGYKTLVIWEHELKNMEEVEKKVLEFHS